MAGAFAGEADGLDFGVGGGVVVGDHLVAGFGDDLAVLDDDGTEWPAFPRGHVFGGQGHGPAEEGFVHGDQPRVLEFRSLSKLARSTLGAGAQPGARCSATTLVKMPPRT